MKRVVLYSASFGGHDEPPEVWDADCDLVLFTDNRLLTRKTWRVVYRPRLVRSGARPRMRAKWHKLSSCQQFERDDLYRRLGSYQYSVWIDAAFWIHHGKGFVDHCLNHLRDGIAFYPHPAEHRTLEQEVAYSSAMPKYDGEPLLEQVQHYRRQGLSGGRLYCGGVIAREHSPAVRALEEDWLLECENWSSQDQLSLPFVLEQHGVTPGQIPGDIYSNPYLYHLWSGMLR
jgi:hypothetical protein